jgi:cytochrome c oxidase subunit 3
MIQIGTRTTVVDKRVRSGPGTAGPHKDDGGRFEPPDDQYQPEKYRIGIWVGIVGIMMLFIALTSAYIVRQTKGLATAEEWRPIQMPQMLWLNTALILASSLTLELARRCLKMAYYKAFVRLLILTVLLGFGFLAGQIMAYRQLAAQGIYLSTNPHSSFFYLLTGLHGIHLLGGIMALCYVTIRGLQYSYGPAKRAGVDAAAIYWHFMDGLWVYLFLLLFFWR